METTNPPAEWITAPDGADLYRTGRQVGATEGPGGWPPVAVGRGSVGRVLTAAFGEFVYTVVDLAIAISFFVFTVTLLSVGLGLAVIWVGVPILVLALLAARFGGVVQRALARSMLGMPVAGPADLRPRRTGPIGWIGAVLRDRASWRAFAYFVIKIVLAPFTFAVAVTMYGYAFGAITYPLWSWRLPPMAATDSSLHRGTPLWTDVWVDTPLLIAVQFVVGLAVLWLGYRAVRALTTLDRVLIGTLLTGRGVDDQR